jgi:hypothetical protein
MGHRTAVRRICLEATPQEKMLRRRLNLNDRYALATLRTLSRTAATRLYGKDNDWRFAAPLHVYVGVGSVKADLSKCSRSARQVRFLSVGNLLRALGKVSMHEMHSHGAFTHC